MNRFNIRPSISPEAMAVEDHLTAEEILAKLVARAYAADNPHLFGIAVTDGGDTESSNTT